MTTIKLDAAALRDVLARAVCDANTPQEIYRHALISADVDGFDITTTDEQMYYLERVDAQVSEPAQFTASVPLLRAALAGLEGEVTLEHNGERLTLRQASRRYRINSLDPQSFPVLEDLPTDDLDLDATILMQAIGVVQYAINPNDGRAFLRGVNLRPDKVQASNAGHNLAVCPHRIEGLPEDGIILPVAALRKGLAKYVDEHTRLRLVWNKPREFPVALIFEDDARRLRVHLIHDKFPDIERMNKMKPGGALAVRVSAATLKDALARVMPFAQVEGQSGKVYKSHQITLSVGEADGQHRLLVESCHNESAADHVVCEIEEGAPNGAQAVGFNADLLKDFLTTTNGEFIWHVNEPRAPQAFTIGARDDVHYIMPIAR